MFETRGGCILREKKQHKDITLRVSNIWAVEPCDPAMGLLE